MYLIYIFNHITRLGFLVPRERCASGLISFRYFTGTWTKICLLRRDKGKRTCWQTRIKTVINTCVVRVFYSWRKHTTKSCPRNFASYHRRYHIVRVRGEGDKEWNWKQTKSALTTNTHIFSVFYFYTIISSNLHLSARAGLGLSSPCLPPRKSADGSDIIRDTVLRTIRVRF